MTAEGLPTVPLGIALLLAVAAAVPWCARRTRHTGLVVAGGYVLVMAMLVPAATVALRGGMTAWRHPVVADLGLSLSFRMDGLTAVFAAIVLGIGALVMVYTGAYAERRQAVRLWRLLTVFAASMLGVVSADDVVTLLVFWEATSVVSFLLIGGDGVGGVDGARRALLVTGAGGMALLAGVTLLAVSAGGVDFATIVAAEPDGAVWATAAILVALGAFTKSAQAPFGFWLRGAMVAPTPVSTYLHAATMVKAGVFLLLRLSPALSDVAIWTPLLVTAGMVTAVLGGVQAIRAYDLKAVLAGSTVSQLGLIVATIGLGHPAALAAAIVHTVAHAAFKAPLFMAAGIVDHQTHVRDLTRLGGLWSSLPRTAVVTAVAALSMAGMAPLLGFVSKEAVLTATAHTSPWLLAGVALASVLTVAYTARFFAGTFLGGRPPSLHGHDPSPGLLVPTMVATGVGLLLGFVPGWLDKPVDAAMTAVAPGSDHHSHLALWHGVTPELLVSVAVVATGVLLAVAAMRRDRPSALRFDGAAGFDGLHRGILRLGGHTARPWLGLSTRGQVIWVVALAGAGMVAAVAAVPHGALPATLAGEWLLLGAVVPLAVVAVTARTRLAVSGVLGGVGLAVSVLWVLRGAPDLALTQIAVEALTIVIIVAVFRRLSDRFDTIPGRRVLVAGSVAVAAGGLVTFLVVRVLGSRPLSSTAQYYLEHAHDDTGGYNVVNTILVDFRALDTLGEITVLTVAALGVAAFVSRPRREQPS